MNVKRSPERAADDDDRDDDELDIEEQRRAAMRAREARIDQDEDDQDAGDTDNSADEGIDDGQQDDDGGERTDEEQAREMGWVPKDEWRGDPKRWRPASEFLKRAYANGPIFREQFERQSRELQELRTTVGDLTKRLEESGEVLQDLNKRNRAEFDRGYKKAKAEIEDIRMKAVEDGDTEAFRRSEQQLADLEAERAEMDGGAGERDEPRADDKDEQRERRQDDDRPAVDPATKAWVAKNAWFQNDEELADHAMTIEKRIAREEPNLPLADRLEKVGREVRRRFPDKFSNARREAPSTVGGGRNGDGNRSSGRTVEDLPQDARNELAKLKRTIPGYTDKEFLRDYEWET